MARKVVLDVADDVTVWQARHAREADEAFEDFDRSLNLIAHDRLMPPPRVNLYFFIYPKSVRKCRSTAG